MTDTDHQPRPNPRVVDPPLEELEYLRQPLTEGERRVLDWFMDILPSQWEIYIQPHLNGLRPDFVLLHPQCGIAVYEVKDWNLESLDYFVQDGRTGPKLMGRRDGKTFSLGSRDPVAAIDHYKREIYGLYAPSLSAGGGYGAIVAGVIFTNAATRDVQNLLRPLREAKAHAEYPHLYPIIGSDLVGEQGDRALRTVLNSARRIDPRMSGRVAADLRHWLVEPSFTRDQRVPLVDLMTHKQRVLCLNKDRAHFRRIKGPAGSGKSLVLAGRAAELAKKGRRVLVLTFNITLVNYLLDLAVQYAQSGTVRGQITALNFHHWCKRIAHMADKSDEYDSHWRDGAETDRDVDLGLEGIAANAVKWAAALDEQDRWDAVLVDEGQDFFPGWWDAVRAALTSDGSGEAMLVADAQQNIYAVKPWTDVEMSGAGFRGPWAALESSYRMSPTLCRLASDFIDRFQPDADEHRPMPPQGELEYRTELRWIQVEQTEAVAATCVEAMLKILSLSDDDPVAVAELVCIVDREDVGLKVTQLLRDRRIHVIHTFGQGEAGKGKEEDGRRKKLAFYRGDARVKITTIQSFKGWENRALVVQISNASDARGLALAYAGITRLKWDVRSCFLTVVCSAPPLREYGATWPVV